MTLALTPRSLWWVGRPPHFAARTPDHQRLPGSTKFLGLYQELDHRFTAMPFRPSSVSPHFRCFHGTQWAVD
jgi:hypothetical protein